MAIDPAASMRIWAVELDLGDRTFEIPAMPAADWFPLLVDGDITGVVDLLDDPDGFDEMLVSGEVSAEDLTTALSSVIEQVCGRPLHAAVALANVANSLWRVIGGELALAGFRWDRQPIGAALDAIDWAAMRTLKKEYADKIRALIDSEVSPVGTSRGRRRPNRAAARAAFEEMAGPPPDPNQNQLGPPPTPPANAPAIGARFAGGPPRSPRPPQQPHQAGRYGVPTPPPGQPAENGPPASHAGPWDAHGPASGNGSPPPQPAR